MIIIRIIKKLYDFLFPRNPRTPSQVAALTGILVLGLGGAAVVSLPIYRGIKKWRASGLLSDALVSLEENDASSARKAATASLKLNPGSLDALRVVAKSSAEETIVESLLLHEKVILAGGDSPAPEDLRNYIRLCLKTNFRAASERALNLLMTHHSDDAQNWVLAGEYLLAEGNREQALNAANKALAMDSHSIPARLLGFKTALWSLDTKIRKAAVSQLLSLGNGSSAESLEALAILALAPHELSDTTAAATAAGLRSHTLSNADAKLLAALLEYRHAKSDQQRQEITQAVISAYFDSDTDALLGWLHLTQQHETIIGLLPEERALKNRSEFSALATALQVTGRDRDLLRLFSENEGYIPMDSFHLHLIQMASQKKVNQAAAASSQWNQAMRKARLQNPEVSLILIAQWCDRHGHIDEAIEAYETLVDQHRDMVAHWYDALVRLYRASGNTKQLLQLSRKLAAAYPKSTVYKHNAAYLEIITDATSMGEAVDALKEITLDQPRAIGSRIALALGYQKMGKVPDAQAAIEGLDREELSALDQLILDIVAVESPASGESSARKALQISLLPEEKSLFGFRPAN